MTAENSLINQATTRIWRRGKLMGKNFKIALVPVLGGAMPGGTPVTVRGVTCHKLRILEKANCNEGGEE